MTLYVVTGPPCVGKSTWVRERAQPGDIVIDLDRIALAITAESTEHHNYPPHIRKAAILLRMKAVDLAINYSRSGVSYIIHAKPNGPAKNRYRKAQAAMVTLDAPYSVLMARAKAERPPHIWGTLAKWYEEPED